VEQASSICMASK